MILPLILFLIWYWLRWYFVIPRDEYLGSFNYKNLYSIRITKKINYDEIYDYFTYSVIKKNKKSVEKKFFLFYYKNNINAQNFILLEKKDSCIIKIKNIEYVEYDSNRSRKFDKYTLLILDNRGVEVFNDFNN